MSQFEMHLNEIMLDSKKKIIPFFLLLPFKPGLSGKHQIGLSYRVCSGLGYGIGVWVAVAAGFGFRPGQLYGCICFSTNAQP